MTADSTYPASGRKPWKHKRVIGKGQEEVLITGAEFLITLRNGHRRLHAFCHSELPADSRLHATYQKHKTTLEAL